MSDEASKVNSSKFSCKSCGGNMEFDPESQSLKCPFCNSTSPIESTSEKPQTYDYNTADTSASHDWGEQKRLIKCDSCGAETMIDPNKTADFCAFCGSSHIANQEDTNPAIAPETIAPFMISKSKAIASFKTWISKKKFAPNALKSQHTMDKVTGVYVPYWAYDSDTFSRYTAQKGTYYYETEKKEVKDANGNVTIKEEEVRHTKWEPVNGNYSKSFDDLLIVGSEKVSQSLISGVEPFDLTKLTKYDARYISGFLAERYSIDIKQAWQMATAIIRERLEDGIENEIGGDEVKDLDFNTDYKTIKYKLTLLPLWISSYRFKDKVYNLIINGQTGKVSGKAPTSVAKVLGLFGGIAGVIAIIIVLVKLFGK